MLRATLVALTLCAWCVAAEDLNQLLLSDRVQSVASYPASKRLSEMEMHDPRVRAPNVNCPTPVSCPIGVTGHFCDILMCPQKNPRPPMNPDNAIEVRAYSPCSGTNFFPVDSTIRDSLYIFVDTTISGSNPSLTLYDPKGNPVTPTKVLLNDTTTLEIQYPVNRMYGMYSATFSASNACIFQAHAQTFMHVGVGFTMDLKNDFPTNDLQQFSYSYVVAAHRGLMRPGRMGIMEIWENGILQSSYDLRVRFNCEYHMFAGPVICSHVNNYQFKAYGIDDNGYEWMRTDTVKCVQSGQTTTTGMPMTTVTGTTTQGTSTPTLSPSTVSPNTTTTAPVPPPHTTTKTGLSIHDSRASQLTLITIFCALLCIGI